MTIVGDEPRHARFERGRQAFVVATVVAAAAVVAVRWYVARRLEVFTLIPDEAAQLSMARTLAGDRWSMIDYSTFRPGFSFLAAPIYWFADDPVTGLRSVFVLNALLGGVTCALLVVAARRLTTMARWQCVAAATLVSLGPALLFTTRYAWAEALVQPLVVGGVLALLWLHDAPSVGRGVLALALAIAGFTTHSRVLPLVLLAAACVAVLAWQRRLTWPQAGVTGLIGAAMLAVSWWLAARMVDLTWTDPYTTNSFSGAFAQWRQVGSMFATTAGHVWYQLAASAGLVGLGAWAALAPGRQARSTARRDGVLVVIAVVALMLLSVAFLAGRPRADRLVYGRYIDPATALLVLMGIGLVLSRGWRTVVRLAVVAGVTLALAGYLLAARREEVEATGILRPMILGVQPFMSGHVTIPVLRITVLSVAVMAVLAVIALLPRRPRAYVLVVVLALLILVGDRRTGRALDRSLNARAPAGAVREVEGDVLPSGAPVRVLVAEGSSVNREAQRQRIQLYQFYLPGHRFDVDGEEPAPTPYVFAPLDAPALVAQGDAATVVWVEPSVDMALWVLET